MNSSKFGLSPQASFFSLVLFKQYILAYLRKTQIKPNKKLPRFPNKTTV